MLEELEVENFRSIKKLHIKLTKLTVLIGANGTGKSNLVKLLEFLGDIPVSGLTMAINKRGGEEWMFPKSIPKKQLKNTKTYIKYKTSFNPPYDDTTQLKHVEVDHSIKIKFNSQGLPLIESEEITFHNVLPVAKLLEDKEADLTHLKNDSTFKVKQDDNGIKITINPVVNNENINDYMSWLGIPESLEIKPESFTNSIQKLWSNREMTRKGSRRKQRSYSLIDDNISSVLDFCAQHTRFKYEVSSIARYDLLLNELREEQNLNASDELLTDGKNLPSIIRKLKNKGNISWDRLRETFCAIAPHIIELSPSTLKRNKEFINFTESKLGRTVESWETSDGSLRALAILTALESARYGATVIIEELEQNLHPWAIRILMRYILEMINEKSLQIIITTHSQQVLEASKPNEVLIASRSSDGGTAFEKLSELHPNVCSEEIGELWVKGLLGGVPSYE